jgi:7-keto-8-aminopelargonate synthetase-like enzyme
MLGDVAPLKEMVAVAKANGAMVLVDEAHSMGFIGENGRGVAEAQGVIDDVDFIIGTF